VFVSSFYREQGFAQRWDSPLWNLRRELWDLNRDPGLLQDVELAPGQMFTWIAERSEPDLSKPDHDPLAVVDRLVEVLQTSQLYVCILADQRGGTADHGSPISVGSNDTAVSYFEIELYAAAMYGKPVHLYLLEGFSPGPRLQKLLDP
jgi:hypothetical protein